MRRIMKVQAMLVVEHEDGDDASCFAELVQEALTTEQMKKAGVDVRVIQVEEVPISQICMFVHNQDSRKLRYPFNDEATDKENTK